MRRAPNSIDANNHQLGLTYDANGNQSWDAQHATAYGWNVENKLVTETSQGWPGAETWYSYDPFGRRVMKDVNADPNGENGGLGYTGGSWEFYFYGITGQKLMTTVCTYYSDGELNCGGGSSYLYFGSRLIQANGSLVVTDRLGSVRAKGVGGAWTQMSYFPYGEERTSTPDGTEKFGTYYRDGVGQDYAEQRYYNNGTGRFWSVDPGGVATANPSNPTSLNRYAYVNGDPVNHRDPRGLYQVIVGEGMCIVGNGEYQEWVECDYSEGGFFSPTDPGEDPGGGGGGGPGKFANCESVGSETQLAFVASHYAAAGSEAATIQSEMPYLANGTQVQANQGNVTAAFLDWSSWESGWGQSNFATSKYNYFGYGNVTFSSSMSWGAELAYILATVPNTPTNPNPGQAPYSSFLVEALINNPNASPASILQAIANAGYNSVDPNYGNTIAGPNGVNVQPMIDCLKSNYASSM